MKQKNQKRFFVGLCLLTAFAVWTFLLGSVDVQAIGPQGTRIGFAAMNQFVHKLTGVNMNLYTLTDWLGLVPVVVAIGFAMLGLFQWIQRKDLWKVDRSILILGGFYLIVMALYVFFEQFVVNYRPVLIEGRLEASYPSSTTMLVICVMCTAIMQFKIRIKNAVIRRCVMILVILFVGFMIVGRLVSGVHWFSDIIGGVLLSAGLVMVYDSVAGVESK